MQFTTKFAAIAAAVAIAAPSVFALSMGSDALEAREYDDFSLNARDLIEEFYEARGFDTRSFNEDLEVREFLDFLDARSATPAAPAATPSASHTSTATGSPAATPSSGPGHHAHDHTHAHIPSVLIHALTAKHHPKLKHYAEVELHIFNLLQDLSDGEAQNNGFKESPEVQTLAKDILKLHKWHHHAHGAHHHAHDSTKPSAAPTPSAASPSSAGAPAPTGTTAAHHAHGHHGKHGLHAKIEELKLGTPKADRYIARAKVHKDRLALLALGPIGEHDEAYESALKHEKEWLERHQKLDAKHHAGHHGHGSGPSASGAATSASASATPAASAAAKADKPADSKTPQGVKRRALRRGYY